MQNVVRREGTTNLLLDNIPLLARDARQTAPDLPPHAHVILSQVLQLQAIPVVSVPPLHEPLMAFPARVRGLGGEVGLLDGCPIHALCAGGHESLVILGGPCARGGTDRCDGGRLLVSELGLGLGLVVGGM